jgi:hypothetical protein
MDYQLPALQEKGEMVETFTRRNSRIFFRRLPGGDLQFLRIAGFLSDHDFKDKYERTSSVGGT